MSPELLKLAQSDAKWHRIKHIPVGGSGGSAGKGGLGFGSAGVAYGRASVALTSSMLAKGDFRNSSSSSLPQTTSAPTSSLPVGMRGLFHRASAKDSDRSVTSSDSISSVVALSLPEQNPAPTTAQPLPPHPSDYAANPYVQGRSQGRGKHLTQPSWMSGSIGSGGHSSNASTDRVPAPIAAAQFVDVTSPSEISVTPRKSRFDVTGNNENQTVFPATAHCEIVNNSNLSCSNGSGAAYGGNSIGTDSGEPPARKRSRWDT